MTNPSSEPLADAAPRTEEPSPMRLLRANGVRLFLTSAVLLFVELLLIRWIPANVIYIGFFSNFLLMASFLGIGLGILLGRRGARPFISPFPLLLLLVVLLVYQAQLNVQIESQDEIFFGLAENTSADVNFLVLPLVVLLVTALMASLALPLGPLLRSMPPLRAYAVDISGSLAGIAGFTALSAAGTDPVVWFSVAAVLLVALGLGSRITRWSLVSAAAMVAVIALSGCEAGACIVPGARAAGEETAPSAREIWSPYYRVSAFEDPNGRTRINVNGIPHQGMWSADDPDKSPWYEQIYRWFPERRFERVLVIGAGSGSDVAVALARGAEHVDAVEIDPVILGLGVADHPDRPYDDPRVERHQNDGRAFLRNTSERYDLVVFALPDSLTLVSTSANLRLESFLFTEQAFAAVRDHLDDDGMFVMYNFFREPWLIAKLASMLEDTFGHPPLLRMYHQVSATLAAGPGVAAALDADGAPPGEGTQAVPEVGAPEPKPATDDWPFLYLRQPFIAPYYLVALGFVLLAAVVSVAGAARVTDTPLRRFSPHFFVLGVAFLLLETRSLVSFSLLFGTTWFVNALAFFAILASVLLAILVNARWPVRRPLPLYLALFAALALAFLLPPESLLIDPPPLRYALAAAVAFAPVFFANLVFTYSFRDTRTADMAFASNLLGAMVGGVLEYFALLSGYRALLLLVAGLYLLAYVFATRWRTLADVDLTLDEDDSDADVGAERRPAQQPAG